MTSLYTAIRKGAGAQCAALLKHLKEAGIADWNDMTRARLYDLRGIITGEVAASSAHTYFAALKAVMGRYADEVRMPEGYEAILKIKNERPVRTWLTPAELKRLEGVETRNEQEKRALYQFLIGAYTGMRISDINNVSTANIVDGQLSYVSEKTSVHAVIPCSERVREYITWVQEHGRAMTLAGYNNVVRRLCRRAGIIEKIKVFRGGREETGEKWRYVSSHTARISFCTNLGGLGVPLLDISRMAGHTSTGMTERYIVNSRVTLPAAARKYFE